MCEACAHKHAQNEDSRVAVPFSAHDKLSARASSGKGKAEARKDHTHKVPELVGMRDRLPFESGVELPEAEIDYKSHDYKSKYPVEKVGITKHYQIPYGTYRTEPAPLRQPSYDKADPECYHPWRMLGPGSLLGEEYRSGSSAAAEFRGHEQKDQKHYGSYRHYIARAFLDFVGSSQIVPFPQEHDTYYYSDDEAENSGNSVPVTAGKPQICPPRTSQEYKGTYHGEKTEEKSYERRRTRSGEIFLVDESGDEGPQDESRYFRPDILDDGCMMKA